MTHMPAFKAGHGGILMYPLSAMLRAVLVLIFGKIIEDPANRGSADHGGMAAGLRRTRGQPRLCGSTTPSSLVVGRAVVW